MATRNPELTQVETPGPGTVHLGRSCRPGPLAHCRTIAGLRQVQPTPRRLVCVAEASQGDTGSTQQGTADRAIAFHLCMARTVRVARTGLCERERTAPTLLHMIFVVLISQDQNPGPQYKNRSTLGPKNAPAFGFGSSKAHDADSQVFISATHAKENQGADGPGPGAYSPRMPTTPRSGSRHFVVSALS